MKFLLTLATLLTLTVVMTAAQGKPAAISKDATFVDYDKVVASVSKPTGGAIFAQVEGARVGSMRRGLVHQGSAEAETHEKTTHIWILLDGEATIITGGTIVNSRVTGNGQVRGPSIEGGVTTKVKKGDVVTIPAGIPHWVKEVPTETIAFYVVDVQKP